MEANMEDDNDYWDHQRPGLKKTVCAWALVAVLGLLFGLAGLVWPSEPTSISFTTAEADLALRARRAFDREKTEDLELSRQANDLDPDDFDRRDVAFGR
jgi:hypothetical protein